jgi:hypothetical protein
VTTLPDLAERWSITIFARFTAAQLDHGTENFIALFVVLELLEKRNC